jgi:dCMP deaminase
MSSRKDYNWLRTCRDSAQVFSTCGKRQYYCVIVDRYGHNIGTGYNGGPKGMPHCVDGACPRFIEGSAPGSNYDNCIAIHAEANALLHSDYTARRDGGTLYVNGTPCYTCAKLIVNSGIGRVVYMEDDSYMDWPTVESFLNSAGITLVGIASSEL